jgi:radical SAM protein (TIGR01212 family)
MQAVELFTLGKFMRSQFGQRVQKLSIDGGFTCPNRDGTKSKGGCTYCNNRSFSLGVGNDRLSIREQIETQINRVRLRGRRKAELFLAYFQSFSNTYAPVERLRQLYDEALSVPEVVGLDIATRPDCVPDPVLDLLQDYAQRTHLWLELGLESSHDRTLAKINRGHTWAEFESAMRRSSGRGMNLCVHMILGLPGETPEMMRQSATRLGQLMAEVEAPAIGIKLHHLHIVKGTALAKDYAGGNIATLTPEEYVPLVCDFLERLPEKTVIQRFMGDTLGDTLIAPHWQVAKSQILNAIAAEFGRRGTHPGSLLN